MDKLVPFRLRCAMLPMTPGLFLIWKDTAVLARSLMLVSRFTMKTKVRRTRLAWLCSKKQKCFAQANEDDETDCNHHADHISRGHRLRITSNGPVDDGIGNNRGRRCVPIEPWGGD